MLNILFLSGLKRRLASLISTLLEVLRVIPGSETVVAPLETLAGILGVTGIGAAAANKTLSQKRLSTITAGLAVLIAAAHYIPALWPFLPYLQKATGLLGAAAIGARK